MKFIFDVKNDIYSHWDNCLTPSLTTEIESLDHAHKRAKRALRQQQRTIDEKNMLIKDLELEIEALTEQLEFYEDMEMLTIFNEDIEY